MGNESKELALRWLTKADHDIITAKQTLLLDEPPTDTVSFHAQQAVEKALKALLTFHEVTFPKIHDLVRLLELVLPYFSELENYRKDFADMTNYSVEGRYPEEAFEPSREEAVYFVKVAEEVVEKVKHKIPPVSSS